MNKRIAYIGLSYPLLYDYKNQASQSQNDISDSPNPIIESPLGLMILYDELWFLCESVCPNNMRNLPYVKFVDKMFSNLYFEGAESFRKNIELEIDTNRNLSYPEILKRMNLDERYGLDTHTHALRIGNIVESANGGQDNLAFDLYILAALKEISGKDIELIANSRYKLKEIDAFDKESSVVEKILIPNIPNYLHIDGPYHPCMEELRNNTYITDFRKWIMENHNTIQHSEIEEMCLSVQQSIKETEDKYFKKYLEDNDKYSFFVSSGTTLIKTLIGLGSGTFSVLDALIGISIKGKQTMEVHSNRWQGFVVDSQNIIEANNLSI